MTKEKCRSAVLQAQRLINSFLKDKRADTARLQLASHFLGEAFDYFDADLPGMPEKEPKRARGTRGEVVGFCLEQGLTANDGEWFFDKNEGCGWTVGRKPIKDWQAVVRTWKRISIFPSQKVPQAVSLGRKLADESARGAERLLERLEER
jgi:hypothetical protein